MWRLLLSDSLDAYRSTVSRIFARIARNPNSQEHTSGTYYEEGNAPLNIA
jgi:hypothetical protein